MKHTTVPVTIQLRIREVEGLEAIASARKISRASLIKNLLRKQMESDATLSAVINASMPAEPANPITDIERVASMVPITKTSEAEADRASELSRELEEGVGHKGGGPERGGIHSGQQGTDHA